MYIEIGELWNFLLGHREVFVDPRKEVFEEVGDRVVHRKSSMDHPTKRASLVDFV